MSICTLVYVRNHVLVYSSTYFTLYLLLCMLVTLPTCHDDRSELNTELTKNAVVAVAMVVRNLVMVFVYK